MVTAALSLRRHRQEHIIHLKSNFPYEERVELGIWHFKEPQLGGAVNIFKELSLDIYKDISQ